MEPFWTVLQFWHDIWQLLHEPSQSKKLCITYGVKDFLVRHAIFILSIEWERVSDFYSEQITLGCFSNLMPACKTGRALTGYSLCLKEAVDGERAGESLLIPVCVGVESQQTGAWTPATISKRGRLLLLASRKRVLSVSMWAYSCSKVCARFLERWVLGCVCFSYRFQLPIFSCLFSALSL